MLTMLSNWHARTEKGAVLARQGRAMFEAEVKYRLDEERAVAMEQALLAMDPQSAVRERYVDRYFDRPDEALGLSGRELRLRRLRDPQNGETTATLTFKDAPFDAQTRSKPEFETQIQDPEALEQILFALGFRQSVQVVKACLNVTADCFGGRHVLTLARVEGLAGVFLEIERLCETKEQALLALGPIADLGRWLGLRSDDLFPGYYTDMVRAFSA